MSGYVDRLKRAIKYEVWATLLLALCTWVGWSYGPKTPQGWFGLCLISVVTALVIVLLVHDIRKVRGRK